MTVNKLLICFSMILMAGTTVQAMIIPGRWEKVAAEKPGSSIQVTLMTGDIMECSFIELTTDSLVVSTPDGVERKYSKDNVARITTTDKRADNLANGTAIGALVAGIPAGIIAGACLASKTCTGSQVGVALPIYIGIGAGIGLAVDAGVKHPITLYVAPASKSKP